MALLAIVQVCVRATIVAGCAMLAAPSMAHADTVAPGTSDSAAAESGTSWHEKTVVDVEAAAETWFGLEAYRKVGAAYSGSTIAPFSNLRQDGFRLRVIAGTSLYRYAGDRYDTASDNTIWQRFSGIGHFIDVLPGWQFSDGGSTVKIFAGYEYQTNNVTPYDTELAVQGTARGAKGAIEIWQNWAPHTWTSLDLSAARANGTYSAMLRAGRRFDVFGDPGWSLGPELAQVGNSETKLRRAGLFIRYETISYEFTVAGGAARSGADSPMAYVNTQFLRRF